MPDAVYKDDTLTYLARTYNVAQFVSFAPDLAIRHDGVCGGVEKISTPPVGPELETVLGHLLKASTGSSINIRSFLPDRPAGNPFRYGITNSIDAAAEVRRLARGGFYTIVNETIDVKDGGVSGVCAGGIIEFSPGDTPRCVEKPGVARLPMDIGFELLQKVYGFPVDFGDPPDTRLEFSIHPLRCGTRHQHTIVWEASEHATRLTPDITWPNNFSRLIGDKAYGLLIADTLGFPVPFTTVTGRNVASFSFGTRTNTGDWWMRTAPKEPVAGLYSTTFGWTDPYAVLQHEDNEDRTIASVLAQEGVDAQYSGATKPTVNGLDLVEGVAGRGDRFMVGQTHPVPLPENVFKNVRAAISALRQQLGNIRIEWAHDGTQVWVVQLHRVPTEPKIINANTPVSLWLTYHTDEPLEGLRYLLSTVVAGTHGIEVVGEFGLTSHIGELLSSSAVPFRVSV